jgi:hypothetical protein
MSPAVQLLAARHRASSAGRTNSATRDLVFPFVELLKSSGCQHGFLRDEAVRDYEELEKLGIVVLERHRRDRSEILKVRLPLRNASALFEKLGATSPDSERAALAAIFLRAGRIHAPAKFQAGWDKFCLSMAEAAESGASIKPFDRARPDQTARILQTLPSILAWESESLIRFASALLFKDSKYLESARPKIEACLSQVTGEVATELADFGILENERSFLIHGPLTLQFENGECRLDLLKNPMRLGAGDLRRAKIETAAPRCLTVENAAMLHELAKAGSGVILASSGSEGGFANSAVVAFLQSLPPDIELWHFGDSDPKGFDILRDLRERVGLEIHSLHMQFRPSPHPENPLDATDQKTIERLLASEFLASAEKVELEKQRAAGYKGNFEQESLGRPARKWPFYKTRLENGLLQFCPAN